MPELSPPIAVNAAEWQIIQGILAELASGLEVWAFGSRASNAAKPYSDLDLAFISARPLSLGQIADLANAFSDSNLPFKVDIVDWLTISEDFRKIISQHYVPLQKAEQ
jgi:uncharacterized protein